MQKKCSSCKKTKDISDFSKNKDNESDGLSKICKECAAKYHAQYRQKQIQKYGKQEYLQQIWEKRMFKKATKKGIPANGFNEEKLKKLRWKLIDYPDKSFPSALSHIDFMVKYNLSVNEYFFIRKQVRENKCFFR